MLRAWIVAAVVAAVLTSLESPAQAAPLGTLTLSASSGSVSQNPMLTGVTTSAACPAGYGTNAAVKVGRNGQFFNLNTIGSAANYDTAPFTLTTNRSMARALTGSDSGTVADGLYEIAVLCAGETLGDHPDRFLTTITVTAGNWQAGGTGGGTSGQMNITATVGAGQTSPSPSPGPGGPLPRTGAPIIAYIGAGLLLLGVGAATVRFFRKQSTS